MTAVSAEGLRADVGSFHLGPIRLEAEPGEAVAVLGPSGAGKTTLLRALAGLLPAREGRVEIEGIECSGLPPERRHLGYVPQGYALLPHRNVFQNVRYPAELQGISGADELAQGLVRRFRLEPIARAFPAQISGGERQRVAMARALAARPRLLLWDEPLAALDAVAQDELLDLLREVLEREAVPMVLVTHDAATAFSLAHRCLVLDHGQSVFFGTLEDLLRRPPNAFCARFLGLENVFRPPDLAAAPHSPFVRWLAAHAGSSGVAFPADRVQWSAGAGQGWKGRLRRMRTTPRGTEVLVDVQGVAVRALSTRAANGGSLPRDTEIWIRLEEDALVPILRKEGGDGSLETRA